MAKLQSSFKNMVLSLTCIALIAAGALAGVFMMTQDTIEDEKQKKQQNAIMEVLPQIEGITIAEPEEVDGLILHKAYKGKECVGTAVETSTDGNKNMPFGGTFKLMVGFDKQGNVFNVVNYVVLEQAETPGLGALMASWFKNVDKPTQNIIGKNPVTTNFKVSKDGGEIDAITASTITSRAFLEAVVKAYNSIAQQPMPIEAVSNATQVKIPTTDVAEGACPYGNDPTTCPGCSEKHCQKKGGQQ
jgi:electron transport complex protein RnfG